MRGIHGRVCKRERKILIPSILKTFSKNFSIETIRRLFLSSALLTGPVN
jgi:hypothetical protein